MSTIALRPEFFSNLGEIAEDEKLFAKLQKYVKRLLASKHDDTCMTKEEFFAKIDRSRKQIEEGKYHVFSSSEELDRYISSL